MNGGATRWARGIYWGEIFVLLVQVLQMYLAIRRVMIPDPHASIVRSIASVILVASSVRRKRDIDWQEEHP